MFKLAKTALVASALVALAAGMAVTGGAMVAALKESGAPTRAPSINPNALLDGVSGRLPQEQWDAI